jgi:hypothetical protein
VTAVFPKMNGKRMGSSMKADAGKSDWVGFW